MPNMNKDWWPAPLAHIPAEDPWAEERVGAAEIKNLDEPPHAGQRATFAALVPVEQIDAVKKHLVGFDHDVSTTGPYPSYVKDRPFRPGFWIAATDLPADRYEALVLQWRSHDSTVLQPDPGFLMTYGLVPRPGREGIVYWDDPRTPRRAIVTVSPPALWSFPLSTHAYVTIARDFLQDYLTLRHMALVQVFWEIRWTKISADIDKQLGGHERIDLEFDDRRLEIGRYSGQHDTVFVQVWGARLIALPGALPITSNPLEHGGLLWPGIDRPVTKRDARTLGISDYVYVDDAVLGDFEGRAQFRIYPETGAVSHGTQWSVSHCRRVGRNLIRLELRKLYEGTPPDIVRHWHKFTAAPPPASAFPDAFKELNIAERTRALTFALVELGEALARTARSVGLSDLKPEDFVGLRRITLEYNGWWTIDAAEAVARHAPLELPVDTFLDRCLSLNKLLVEGLSEASLRRTLRAIGVPGGAIQKLRALKLLDSLVRLAELATSTALTISKDGEVLWQRLAEDVIAPAQPIKHLFALYDMRTLKAHLGDLKKRLQPALERFGIEYSEAAGGFGEVLDQVYDLLIRELQGAAAIIAAAV